MTGFTVKTEIYYLLAMGRYGADWMDACCVYGDMSHDQWKTSGLVGIQSIRYTEAAFSSIRLHVLHYLIICDGITCVIHHLVELWLSWSKT